MKRFLILLLAALVLPKAVNAFWSLTEEERSICRYRASQENTDFRSNKTFNYCIKNIKSELKEKDRKRLKELKLWKGDCDKEKNDLKKYLSYSKDRKYNLFDSSIAKIYFLQCKSKLKEYNKNFGEKNK